MSRYSVILTRQTFAYRHPAVATPARKTVTISTKRIYSQPEQSDNSDEQTKKLRRKIEKLRAQKKALLYSRPILYGMSGSFFALFGVYAWGSQKRLKEKRQVVTPLQSKLDELD